MKQLILKIFVVIVCVALFSSCSLDKVDPNGKMEKAYFVDVDGAVLPVTVAGQTNSDVAIIFVHGGPGNSSQLARKGKGLFDLESEYKMVYYDQRASGVTQGNSSEDELTIEQFSEDLDVIVDFTREVVGAETIYLMGHSWGGGLTTYYLLEEEHEQKIQGWIAVAPAFNIVQGMINSRNWIITIAAANVLLDNNRNYWQNALTWYDNHPVITQGIFIDHVKYLNRADGGRFSPLQEVDVDLPDYQGQAALENFLYTQSNMTIGGELIFDALELDPFMNDITLPTILLWGERDGFLPVEQGLDFLDAIGTAPTELFYAGFSASAHGPMVEEPTLFHDMVETFVEETR